MATLPLLLLYLPAGAVVDRYDRRRVMLFTEGGRLDRDRQPGARDHHRSADARARPHRRCDRGLLRDVLPGRGARRRPASGPAPAASRRPRSERGASSTSGIIGGQTAGGLLYAMGRAVPFVADCVTYFISLVSIALIRTPLQEPAGATARGGSIREGLTWLWGNQFPPHGDAPVRGQQHRREFAVPRAHRRCSRPRFDPTGDRRDARVHRCRRTGGIRGRSQSWVDVFRSARSFFCCWASRRC